VIVVDNASTDGTSLAIARAFPDVRLVRADGNLGAAGRNAGLRAAPTPYVALADDDTWWTMRALDRAAAVLDAHPTVAVVSGSVVIEPDGRLDPVCEVMARSPLHRTRALRAPRLCGFLAGASMVRREAILAVGGFEPRLFLGSEETLLTADLAAEGWDAVYAEDVVVHHRPSRHRDAGARRRLILRNDLWFAWRRRPVGVAVAATLALSRRAAREPDARAALASAAKGLGWALATRRPLPRAVEADYRALDRWMSAQRSSHRPSAASASAYPARPAVSSPLSCDR
jgi:GT2 family glycosyltransferase